MSKRHRERRRGLNKAGVPSMVSSPNFSPANPASLILSHHFSFPSFISRWFDNAFAASPAISLLSSISLKSTLRSNPTAKPRSRLGKTKESRRVVTRWTNSKWVSILIAGNPKSGGVHWCNYILDDSGCEDRAYLGKDNGSVNGDEVKVQLPEPSTKVPSPPSKLCWVTPNLKEGPSADVRGVSSEVRKVLEILVGKINTKVQAGKDRYQFLRILSQVAYLEGMVNDWAYALLSLEQDSPDLAAMKSKPRANLRI